MQTKPKLWDKEALNAHKQAEMERALDAQSEQDRQRAAIYIERAICDRRGIHAYCALPGCRRARRCLGNPPVCLSPDVIQSRHAQAAIDDIYVKMQEQRRDAMIDGRKLDWLDPVTRKLPEGR
jgi:hypothetical protein